MIWVHCGNQDDVTTSLSLAARLLDHDARLDVLITAEQGILPAFAGLVGTADVVAIPTDTPTKTKAFLDEWMPQYLIWNGGPVRPALLRNVAKFGVRSTLINARHNTLLAGGSRWIPRASRNAIEPFDKVLTADGATATRLIRGGASRDKVMATGPILEEPVALPHDQNELTVLAETLGTRPVWFAANIVAAEVMHIATAHLAASRKSHRLLLVVTPRDLNSGPQVAHMIRDAGLKVGLRSDGDEPMPEQQVYVADVEQELGLWYRIVPLSFMGGTLSEGGSTSPFEPIVLGSAVIHGPRKAPHEDRFARLADVQACREIRSAAELGIAVGALISPEQTARMALAGWNEITQNAETINALVIQAVEASP